VGRSPWPPARIVQANHCMPLPDYPLERTAGDKPEHGAIQRRSAAVANLKHCLACLSSSIYLLFVKYYFINFLGDRTQSANPLKGGGAKIQTGACRCGGVRYQLLRPVLSQVPCHCCSSA
jgi:hypothetical protein